MLSPELHNVLDNMLTVQLAIKDLSDADLYDCCILDIELHKREDLDQLYEKLALGGKLTVDERKKVEAFFILTNLQLWVHV